MAKSGITKSENISATAREIDFVSSFARNLNALREVMGVSNLIAKESGTVLKQKKATVNLAQSAAEGEEIAYSQANVVEIPYGPIVIEKYGKGVTIEAISNYGYDVAVQKTDEEFKNQLQTNVKNKFFAALKNGALTDIETGFQLGLAMAKGLVENKWRTLGRDCDRIVGFVNVIDFYRYLGNANVTVQNTFGLSYVQGYMGYDTIFLCAEGEIPADKIIATPVNNLVGYYVNPADSDIAKAGFDFTADESGFVGFHTEGNYHTATSEATALLGVCIFAEYLDGVAVVKVEASGSLGSVTVASVAGAVSGDSKVTITYTAGAGETLYYKDASAVATPEYKEVVDLTGWVTVEAGEHQLTLTSGNKLTVIAVNGAGQAVASGNATIVVKS